MGSHPAQAGFTIPVLVGFFERKKPAQKTGETERLFSTFSLGSVGLVETSENRSFLLPSQSGRSGIHEYRLVTTGMPRCLIVFQLKIFLFDLVLTKSV
jgi:hypothetical protein